jgi:hypothetical protein
MAGNSRSAYPPPPSPPPPPHTHTWQAARAQHELFAKILPPNRPPHPTSHPHTHTPTHPHTHTPTHPHTRARQRRLSTRTAREGTRLLQPVTWNATCGKWRRWFLIYVFIHVYTYVCIYMCVCLYIYYIYIIYIALVQYYDVEVESFVDLLDGDESWQVPLQPNPKP